MVRSKGCDLLVFSAVSMSHSQQHQHREDRVTKGTKPSPSSAPNSQRAPGDSHFQSQCKLSLGTKKYSKPITKKNCILLFVLTNFNSSRNRAMLPLISYQSIPVNGQKMLSHTFFSTTGIIEREAGIFANFEMQ